MRKSDLITLFDYNYWANRKIWAVAEQATQAQLELPTTLSHGTVFGTLIHTLAAEWVWRLRCQEGISPAGLLTATDITSMSDLLARWREEEAAMREYLESLPEGDVEQTIHYANTRGDKFESALWQILVHVVNHGTQHRGEVAHFMTELGYSPGDIDFSRYFQR